MKNIPLLIISISLLFISMPYAQAQQGELATIEITATPPLGSPPNIEIGQSVVFTAVGKDADGNIVPIPDPGWYSDGVHGTITVDPNDPNKCTYTATAEGADYIQCCDGLPGTGVHGSLDFNVVAGSTSVPASVTMTPETATAAVGEEVPLTAIVEDQNGNEMPDEPVTFEAEGGTITPEGVYTGIEAGEHTVTVKVTSDQTILDTSIIRVTESAPEIESIKVKPGEVIIGQGEQQSFEAEATYDNGDTATITPTWSASGGVIDDNGLYTATMAGDHIITATDDDSGVTGTATVHVEETGVDRTLPSQNQVQVDYVNSSFDGVFVPDDYFLYQFLDYDGECQGGEPISHATGEFVANVVDLSVKGKGRINFCWARFYGTYSTNYSGVLGYKWSHNYEESIAQSGSDIRHWNPSRRVEATFTWNGSGYDSPTGKKSLYCKLVKNADNTYSLRYPTGKIHTFYGFTGSPTDGALKKIEDENGFSVLMQYDNNGLLTTVKDAYARSINIEYDASFRISTVTDFSGRQIVYTYDGNGDLVAIRSPIIPKTRNIWT